MFIKPYLLAQMLAGLTIILGGTATLCQSISTSRNNSYFCGLSKDGTGRPVPATIVRTPRGDVPIIRWVSGALPSSWNPQQRCEEGEHPNFAKIKRLPLFASYNRE